VDDDDTLSLSDLIAMGLHVGRQFGVAFGLQARQHGVKVLGVQVVEVHAVAKPLEREEGALGDGVVEASGAGVGED
jgi:hypothetical protein